MRAAGLLPHSKREINVIKRELGFFFKKKETQTNKREQLTVKVKFNPFHVK